MEAVTLRQREQLDEGGCLPQTPLLVLNGSRTHRNPEATEQPNTHAIGFPTHGESYPRRYHLVTAVTNLSYIGAALKVYASEPSSVRKRWSRYLYNPLISRVLYSGLLTLDAPVPMLTTQTAEQTAGGEAKLRPSPTYQSTPSCC